MEARPLARSVTFTVELAKGRAPLQTWLTLPTGGTRGAYFVYVRRL